MTQTYKISITGQVQGVGFRPYVYNLATRYSLFGQVSNNTEGVLIYVQGTLENCSSFYKELIDNPPPVSRILNSSFTKSTASSFKAFQIITSSEEGTVNLSLTPDFALCKSCTEEMNDVENRRYKYAFTTCVHCGPRWAITKEFPFERANTAINSFEMCEACMEEYTKPEDRRFHSQTNSCIHCGISMQLLDNQGREIKTAKASIFKEASTLLKRGKIIAIKNTSGFLLCCNAENAEAIKTLRIRKNRKNKPFALLFPNLKRLKETVTINIETETALKSTERPICIVNSNDLNGSLAVDQIAPGLHQLGIMLPYTGILQLLANELEFPIIATSGNIHGSPIISKNDDAVRKLGAVADCFLVHNLSIEHPQDDSVLKHSFKFRQPVLFRRARGLAPNYFNAGIASNQRIMAMGGHLKSSIAFYPNDYLYISQYIGNLDNYDVYERFTENIDSFISIFQQNPSVILVDAHPMYQSTTYGRELAKRFNINAVEIQHHKAHFAAILGDCKLFDKRVLGVIFDGTGYGDDGAIWGGEFFNYNAGKIERTGHVNYFDWLLSDKMSKEPRLSLLSIGGNNLDKVFDQKFESHELVSFKTLKANNKLKTSSVGRLFDAVASLLNLTDNNTYEGEAAILLENQISTYDLSSCKSYLKNPKNGINPVEIIRNIQIEQEQGIPVSTCVENFIFTLANAIIKIAESKDYEHIACSGGVFQNTTLVDMLLEICPDTMVLHFHQGLSPNDENISFGQIMYYLNCR